MMSSSDRLLLLLPSVLLVAVGTYLGAVGVVHSWWPGTHPTVAVAISGSLHVAWLGAAFRRRAVLAGVLCWVAALSLSADGGAVVLGPEKRAAAIGVEAIPLLLAMGWRRQALAERLGHWRRTRARVRAELEQSTGVVPWARRCWAAFLYNGDRQDGALDRARLLIEMTDADQIAGALPRSSYPAGERRR